MLGSISKFQISNYRHQPNFQHLQYHEGGEELEFERVIPPTEMLGDDVNDESDEEEISEVVHNYHGSEQANHEEEEAEEKEEEDNNNSEATTPMGNPSSLPRPPNFIPFIHPTAPHERLVQLPTTFSIQSESSALPSAFFKLFFFNKAFEILAHNTNSYAEAKGAGAPGHHRWYPTSVPDLQIFFGLIIYMGVLNSSQNSDYWSTNPKWPHHGIGCYMTQNRFEQLKCFFQISEPFVNLP